MTDQKKKQPFHFNVGIISFLMIFVYILGHLYIYLNKDELAVYEVIESQIHDSIYATGLILRDESVVKGDNSGYINYYVDEGDTVSKNGLVYSCDESGEVHEYISNLMQQQEVVSAKDYDDIKEELKSFEENYTDSQFQSVYSLKYNLENKALKLGDTIMQEHMDEIESKMGSKSLIKNYSSFHGIITYIEDGFENKTVSDLTKDDFEVAAYKKTDLKKSDKINKGDSVYRIVKSQTWQIILLLRQEEYKELKDKTKLTVNLGQGECSLVCPVEFQKEGDSYFAILTLRDYLTRFVTSRYVDVEIEVKSENGLKIPNSSIVEKEFYKIPKAYLTGKIASNKTLMKKKQDKKGKITFESINVDIGRYEVDENGQGYYYILKEEVPENTLISMPDSNETMLLKETVKLPGVYNINKGYADFRCVDVLMENKDYTIVKQGVTNSIALFDRIALNGSTVNNNDIIY